LVEDQHHVDARYRYRALPFGNVQQVTENGFAKGDSVCGVQRSYGFGISVDHEQAWDSFRTAAPIIDMARSQLMQLLAHETDLILHQNVRNCLGVHVLMILRKYYLIFVK
jgi:hypothetical protein